MPAEYSQAKWCADRAIEFISEAQSKEKPWFFSFNCFDPHHPFDPPKEYLERYLPILDELPLPEYTAGELDYKPPTQRKEHNNAYGVKGHFPYDEMTEYDHRLVKAASYALCDLVDEQIGRILKHLEESGELDNTIIVFHSDHGESLGDHGMYLKGCYFYESNVNVPLIISWKNKFKSGVVSDALVELLDIAPTLLEACGIPVYDGMQGYSLYQMLSGNASLDTFRKDVFCEYYKSRISGELVAYASMLFDGRYKLTALHALASSYPDEYKEELYDLVKDPNEHNNLYNEPEYQEIKLRMLEAFCRRQAMTADKLPQKSMPW